VPTGADAPLASPSATMGGAATATGVPMTPTRAAGGTATVTAGGMMTGTATVGGTTTATPGAAMTATVGAAPGSRTKVTVAMGYIPNVQFAPYYVALDKGYYAAEGLDVEFKYAEVTDTMKATADGVVDFVVTSGDEMIPARIAGIPVVYIMAQYQRYPVGATTIAGNGPPLRAPADLKGRNIGIPFEGGASLVALKALLKAGNLTDADVTLTTIGFTQVEALSQKRVDVAMTYLMNEPVQLQKLGHQTESLNASDYVNLISVGAATSEKNIQERPALVQGFVTASLRGLRDTLADPDAAFASSMNQTPEVTGDAVPVQRAVLSETLTFMQPPTGHPLGWSDPAGWQATQDLLKSVNMIETTVDPATIFTNQFVEAAKP
jgi:NitT/TauT family transport system substrate-binding protein